MKRPSLQQSRNKPDLYTMEFPDAIKIKNENIWLDREVSLPFSISYEATASKESDELIGCFSHTRSPWGAADADALTWFLSPYRSDLTFRTKFYHGFPTVERHEPEFRITVHKPVQVHCRLAATSATYFVNGKKYATAKFSMEDVPQRGYFGFAAVGDDIGLVITDISTAIPSSIRLRGRAGGWLPQDRALTKRFIDYITKKPDLSPDDIATPVMELSQIVKETPGLEVLANAMFTEALPAHVRDPLGEPAVQSWDEFIAVLAKIMTIAPEFYVESPGSSKPAGLVGFPINALLDWPMATAAGYQLMSNQLFNQKMRSVLLHWGKFLTTQQSTFVLDPNFMNSSPPAIGWLSNGAMGQIIMGVMQTTNTSPSTQSGLASLQGLPVRDQFVKIFDVPDITHPLFGFTSWDQFFTRKFLDWVRPVGDALIVSACESAPLQYVTGARLSGTFWAKGQPYSLGDMLSDEGLSAKFDGGSVYQGYLSAFNYHRWNSPVDGTIKKAFVVPSAYYLEFAYAGFLSTDPDPVADNNSMPFITSCATRAVIFIEADDPRIGLMAFVAVGMGDVSSCDITVTAGQRMSKGEQIGMFHFGGSTHCLVFRPSVNLQFLIDPVPMNKQNLTSKNVAVNWNLAQPL